MLTVPAAQVSGSVVRPRWYRAYRVARVALSLTPLMLVHLALGAIPYVEFTVWSVVAVLVGTRITGIGITVGFHRYLAHHSFKTYRWVQFLLAFAGCAALQQGPLWWVVFHRRHHKHSDTPGDPHSPVVHGFWYSHMGWVLGTDNLGPDLRSVRDLTKYPELVWLNRLWMVPAMLMAAAWYAVLGWNGVIYGYCLSVVLTFQVTFAVNSVGHTFGRQQFDTGDGSRNNLWLGILGLGEGWHNNHHQFPYSARSGFRWYEFDMGYQFIRLLRLVGLAWDVKVPPAELLAGRAAPAPVAEGS